MRTAIVLLMAAGLGLNVYSVKAQDAVRRALAEELLNEMQMKENLEKSFAMIKRMIPSQAKSVEQAAGKENQPSSGTNMADKMATPNGKIMDEMAQEMSWEKMKDDYISLYAETFTEEELKGIIAFYKSSAGQAFTTKQPELMRRTMELTQKRMLQWMPKIQAMSKDRIKSSHTGVKEAAPPAEGTGRGKRLGSAPVRGGEN